MHTRENLKLHLLSHLTNSPLRTMVFFFLLTHTLQNALTDHIDAFSSISIDFVEFGASMALILNNLYLPLFAPFMNYKASIISIMAHGDLPEKWPDLLENLTGCLLSEDMNLVHGAMKTLDLFASGNQLSDFHVPPLVDIVFPQLQRIFGEEGYPERIRMRAIRILHSIMAWLGTVKAEYPESIVGAVRPSLPGWYALFQSELSKPDEYGTGHGSKIGVLLVLFQLLVHFPEFIKADLPALVEPLWHSLTNSVEIWERNGRR